MRRTHAIPLVVAGGERVAQLWMGLPAVLGGGAVVSGRENGNTHAMVIGALTFVVAIGCELFA